MTKAISNLLKAYNNDNKKYNNKLFDILSTKLFFFYKSYIRLRLERY
jgi:hypothetical protein